MVKPAAPTIGLHQADVIFVGELINAIKEPLTVLQIADHDHDLEQPSARKNSDLGDRPGITLDEALHLAFGDRRQDVRHRKKTTHTLEQARQLGVIGVHH